MASRGVVCLFLLWFVPFFFSLRSLEFLFLSLCWWDGQSTACSHRTVFYFERGVGRTHSLFCSEGKCLWVRIYSISDSGHCCSQVSWPPLFDVSPFGFLTEPNFVWPSFHFCLTVPHVPMCSPCDSSQACKSCGCSANCAAASSGYHGDMAITHGIESDSTDPEVTE